VRTFDFTPQHNISHYQPNILWITLDSVRADHTSTHDYHRDTTPELQRIANHEVGNYFQNAIAHSNKTPTSVPSMLTGMSYSRHQMIGTKRDAMLPDSIQTVPELLSPCGYQTIGISENVYAGK
jgi:arylsulfatase A-like enzyme